MQRVRGIIVCSLAQLVLTIFSLSYTCTINPASCSSLPLPEHALSASPEDAPVVVADVESAASAVYHSTWAALEEGDSFFAALRHSAKASFDLHDQEVSDEEELLVSMVRDRLDDMRNAVMDLSGYADRRRRVCGTPYGQYSNTNDNIARTMLGLDYIDNVSGGQHEPIDCFRAFRERADGGLGRASCGLPCAGRAVGRLWGLLRRCGNEGDWDGLPVPEQAYEEDTNGNSSWEHMWGPRGFYNVPPSQSMSTQMTCKSDKEEECWTDESNMNLYDSSSTPNMMQHRLARMQEYHASAGDVRHKRSMLGHAQNSDGMMIDFWDFPLSSFLGNLPRLTFVTAIASGAKAGVESFVRLGRDAGNANKKCAEYPFAGRSRPYPSPLDHDVRNCLPFPGEWVPESTCGQCLVCVNNVASLYQGWTSFGVEVFSDQCRDRCPLDNPLFARCFTGLHGSSFQMLNSFLHCLDSKQVCPRYFHRLLWQLPGQDAHKTNLPLCGPEGIPGASLGLGTSPKCKLSSQESNEHHCESCYHCSRMRTLFDAIDEWSTLGLVYESVLHACPSCRQITKIEPSGVSRNEYVWEKPVYALDPSNHYTSFHATCQDVVHPHVGQDGMSMFPIASGNELHLPLGVPNITRFLQRSHLGGGEGSVPPTIHRIYGIIKEDMYLFGKDLTVAYIDSPITGFEAYYAERLQFRAQVLLWLNQKNTYSIFFDKTTTRQDKLGTRLLDIFCEQPTSHYLTDCFIWNKFRLADRDTVGEASLYVEPFFNGWIGYEKYQPLAITCTCNEMFYYPRTTYCAHDNGPDEKCIPHCKAHRAFRTSPEACKACESACKASEKIRYCSKLSRASFAAEASEVYCVECIPGYILSGRECVPRLRKPNCVQANVSMYNSTSSVPKWNYTCTKCRDGFKFDPNFGECMYQCHSSCKACHFDNEKNDQNAICGCNPATEVNDSKLADVSDHLDGREQWEIKLKLNKDSSMCVRCGDHCEECIGYKFPVPTKDYQCTKCAEGYSNKNTEHCMPETCNSICTQCKGVYPAPNYKCTQCPPGYILDENQKECIPKCLPNCEVCRLKNTGPYPDGAMFGTSPYRCFRCAKGFEKYIDITGHGSEICYLRQPPLVNVTVEDSLFRLPGHYLHHPNGESGRPEGLLPVVSSNDTECAQICREHNRRLLLHDEVSKEPSEKTEKEKAHTSHRPHVHQVCSGFIRILPKNGPKYANCHFKRGTMGNLARHVRTVLYVVAPDMIGSIKQQLKKQNDNEDGPMSIYSGENELSHVPPEYAGTKVMDDIQSEIRGELGEEFMSDDVTDIMKDLWNLHRFTKYEEGHPSASTRSTENEMKQIDDFWGRLEEKFTNSQIGDMIKGLLMKFEQSNEESAPSDDEPETHSYTHAELSAMVRRLLSVEEDARKALESLHKVKEEEMDITAGNGSDTLTAPTLYFPTAKWWSDASLEEVTDHGESELEHKGYLLHANSTKEGTSFKGSNNEHVPVEMEQSSSNDNNEQQIYFAHLRDKISQEIVPKAAKLAPKVAEYFVRLITGKLHGSTFPERSDNNTTTDKNTAKKTISGSG
eukprot:Nk52_evm89s208 gene=Nk52_evmTU89s208